MTIIRLFNKNKQNLTRVVGNLFQKSFVLGPSLKEPTSIIIEEGNCKVLKNEIISSTQVLTCGSSINTQKFLYTHNLTREYVFYNSLPFFKKKSNVLASLSKILFCINKLNVSPNNFNHLTLLLLGPKKGGFSALYLGLIGTISSVTFESFLKSYFSNALSIKTYFKLAPFFLNGNSPTTIVLRLPVHTFKLDIITFFNNHMENPSLETDETFSLENEHSIIFKNKGFLATNACNNFSISELPVIETVKTLSFENTKAFELFFLIKE